MNSIDYDVEVENQIKVQQQAYMQVQTAIANSKKAEQDAITTELQGKAAAAKAKWEQEVIKAQAITQAQQEKEVAELAGKGGGVDALAANSGNVPASRQSFSPTRQISSFCHCRLECSTVLNSWSDSGPTGWPLSAWYH